MLYIDITLMFYKFITSRNVQFDLSNYLNKEDCLEL